jgi:hypothetical protein
MHRRLAIAALFLLATPWMALAATDPSLQELEARADAAPLEERPQLYVEIAQQQLAAASESYKVGNAEQARVAVDDVVLYSGKAREASIRSGKKLKNTEISVRKMAKKLRDLKHTLNFDDQAPVQVAADQLEAMRSELLSHMFSKGKR